MRFAPLSPRAAAAAAHMLTASGVLFGLAGLHQAARGQWEAAFLWLGAALIVDGLDGPLARWSRAEAVLPRFAGTRLDLVVDYLNYCIVPAFILWESGIMPAPLGALSAGLVAVTSLFHFADTESKTPDGYFVGFPALWNIVGFYLFAFGVHGLAAFAAVLLFSGLTFVPLTWVHPLRGAGWRAATWTATLAWAAAALATAMHGFPAPAWAQAALAVTGLYGVGLGLWRGLGPRD